MTAVRFLLLVVLVLLVKSKVAAVGAIVALARRIAVYSIPSTAMTKLVLSSAKTT